MTTLRKTPALSNNGGVKVNDDTYVEEVNANTVALWARNACWLNSIAGTVNNITASADAPLTASPVRPQAFWLIPTGNNTTNVTINIDAQGIVSILDISGNALVSGSLQSGALYLIVFDGVNFRVVTSAGSSSSINPAPDAIFADEKSPNVGGGNFVSGGWQHRDLQTSLRNTIAGAVLDGSTGQFTLQPGTYYVEWIAPASGVGVNLARLFNVTNNSVEDYGESCREGPGTNNIYATGRAVITPSVANVYRIEHKGSSTNNTTGFGTPTNFGTFERYTVVKIWKVGQLQTQVNGLPGGAISFFQTFNSGTTNVDPGSGMFSLNNATENTATAAYLDLLDSSLTDFTALLDTFDASTASTKGSLRVTKWDDPTKWLVFNLTARITHVGYREMTIVPVASSAASPFANGDKCLLTYSPVGPKGDTGSTGAPGSTGTVTAAVAGLSMINGSLVFSNNGTALTVAIKQADGVTNPTGGAPVMILMRNGTASNGTYQIVSITTAKSLVIPSTATLAFVSGVAGGRLWFFFTEDGQLGVVNCVDANQNVYPLGQFSLLTTLAIAGGSNLAQQPYSTSAVSNKAYAVLGYATYETALATAGTWNANPDHVELFHPGMTPLPGQPVQEQGNITGAVGTTTALTNTFNDSVPNGGTGLQVLSQAITPGSQGNILDIEAKINHSAGNSTTSHALFQDNAGAGTSALATSTNAGVNTSNMQLATLRWRMRSNKNGASTTFTVRANGDGANNYTFNGIATTTRRFGGTLDSFLKIREIQG